ncbi:MAG: hypothetical protein IPP06_06020 [Saprospiraceae bacterium]|nr:hypothetical protein [Candidatus Vicinibacter affinis]
MLNFFEGFSMDNYINIAAVVVALGTFLWSQRSEGRKNRKMAAREVYQGLELAAIDLFRFEANNIGLIRPIWEKDIELDPEHTTEYYVTLNYVCQLLNLFEMAIQFKRDDIMPEGVFKSWIAWFGQLILSPKFDAVWPELKINYTEVIVEIFDKGIALKHASSTKDEFYYSFRQYILDRKEMK